MAVGFREAERMHRYDVALDLCSIGPWCEDDLGEKRPPPKMSPPPSPPSSLSDEGSANAAHRRHLLASSGFEVRTGLIFL